MTPKMHTHENEKAILVDFGRRYGSSNYRRGTGNTMEGTGAGQEPSEYPYMLHGNGSALVDGIDQRFAKARNRSIGLGLPECGEAGRIIKML